MPLAALSSPSREILSRRRRTRESQCAAAPPPTAPPPRAAMRRKSAAECHRSPRHHRALPDRCRSPPVVPDTVTLIFSACCEFSKPPSVARIAHSDLGGEISSKSPDIAKVEKFFISESRFDLIILQIQIVGGKMIVCCLQATEKT